MKNVDNEFLIPIQEKRLIEDSQFLNVMLNDDSMIIEGFVHFNLDSFNEDRNEVKLNLIDKSRRIIISNDVSLNEDVFSCSISKNDLFNIKNMSEANWNLVIAVYDNQKIVEEMEINYLSEHSILCEETIALNRDEINVLLLNDNGKVRLRVYNEISIGRIINMVTMKDSIKIKYRTKNTLSSFDKAVTTNIQFGDVELSPYKTRHIGNKTYVCYYKSCNPAIDIESMLRKGVSVIVKNGEKEYTSQLPELDKNSVYYSFWEHAQNSRYYKKISLLFYKSIFLQMPIKKKRVLFESFLGRNVSGNPKYIYNYFIEHGLDEEYDLIWILNSLNENMPSKGKAIRRKSLKYYYYMATSGYWVFNSRQADEIRKRKGTTYLQTWHGTPLKRLGADMFNATMAGVNDVDKYKEKFKRNSARWDYLIAQNEYSANIFDRAFYFDNEMLTLGYPANDILYVDNNVDNINRLKEKFCIPKDKKVILYCPTWREDKFFKKGHYKMSLELDLDKMKKELGNEYIILLRLHYLITNSINISDYEGFAYDFSGSHDIQELYLVCDVQVTDYSSTMFDFANLRRPEIFFTYDLENYRDSLRGFYFELEEEAPGPVVRTTDDVIYWLKNLEKLKEDYKKKEEAFYNKFCRLDGEYSSRKVVEKVFLKD